MTAKKAARCKKSRTGVTPNGFFMRLPGSGSAAALHNRSERKWLHSGVKRLANVTSKS
jgi:hypothetical protein